MEGVWMKTSGWVCPSNKCQFSPLGLSRRRASAYERCKETSQTKINYDRQRESLSVFAWQTLGDERLAILDISPGISLRLTNATAIIISVSQSETVSNVALTRNPGFWPPSTWTSSEQSYVGDSKDETNKRSGHKADSRPEQQGRPRRNGVLPRLNNEGDHG
jgi:hypothetical protein